MLAHGVGELGKMPVFLGGDEGAPCARQRWRSVMGRPPGRGAAWAVRLVGGRCLCRDQGQAWVARHLDRQEVRHARDALVDGRTQGAAVRAPCGLDVLEGKRHACVVLAHRTAKELVAVEHPDLGQVARVVADGDGLADIRGQHRINVAQALEVDAVAPHAARLGEHDQQQVEVLQALGAARQEAVAPPSVERCLANLAMGSGSGTCRR